MHHMEKCQITDLPKVRVSSFLSVNGNGISALAIMKKSKNSCHFVNMHHMKIFQITNPHKVWISGVQGVNGNGTSTLAINKK